MKKQLVPIVLLVLLALIVAACSAPTPAPAPAPEVAPITEASESETGPIAIIGEANSADFAIQPGLFPNPSVVLLDATNYLKGQPEVLVDDTAQIMGAFTTSMFPLPGEFRISLPIQPNGGSVDLDNDGEEDEGIQIFWLSVSSNLIGNSYLQQLEQSEGLGSTLADSRTGEITEGSFLIYAPDDDQGFPSAIGDDGKWFTADDPTAPLSKGYTVATLNNDGAVAFDRSTEAVINTIEPAERASPDFSDQGILESYDSLIDVLKERYSYTELRQLDWEEIRAEYLPQVEEADANQDSAAYFLALYHMAQSIQDGHVQAIPGSNREAILALGKDFFEPLAGNVGARLVAISDPEALAEAPEDTVVILTVGDDGPAQQAGLVPGAEIVSMNGETPAERYESIPVLSPIATEEKRRLEQTELMLKFPMSETVTIEYTLPDSSEVHTATMVAGAYDMGAVAPSLKSKTPITYEQIGSYAVLRWSDFMDSVLAKIAVEEEALSIEAGNPSAGVILDLRGNGGGWSELYETMASYFFTADDPMPAHVFDWYRYDQDAGDLVLSKPLDVELSAPRPELAYTGPVVVLVDEHCASACEYFTQHLQVLDRATVMGQHGTSGAGGPIDRAELPDGLIFQFTNGRTTFAGTDEFNLEAKGVTLDIRIPVTLESELAKINGEDPMMEAAIAQLDEMTGVNGGGPADLAENLLGSWMWGLLTDSINGLVEIADLENYILTFNEDGTVNVQADCNNAQGSYTLDDGSLSIEIGPMTMAACEAESHSDDFIKYLGSATAASIDGGNLIITLETDDGLMYFMPAEDGS